MKRPHLRRSYVFHSTVKTNVSTFVPPIQYHFQIHFLGALLSLWERWGGQAMSKTLHQNAGGASWLEVTISSPLRAGA